MLGIHAADRCVSEQEIEQGSRQWCADEACVSNMEARTLVNFRSGMLRRSRFATGVATRAGYLEGEVACIVWILD